MSSLLVKTQRTAVAALMAVAGMASPTDAIAELNRDQAIECTPVALINAITAANSARQTTITLPADCTYSLAQADNTSGTRGPNGLPMIRENITLVGGANTVIERASRSTAFRIFEVSCGGRLTLRSVIVQNGDSGAHTGGAILNARGTVILDSSTVRRSTGDNGAGISNDTGTLTMTGSTVSDNVARGGGAGGIYNDGTFTMNGGRVARNRANTSGGGIYNEMNGTMELSNTTVQHNLAFGSGGAVYNAETGGSVTMNNISIYANSAAKNGGAIANESTMALTTAAFIYNSSGGEGGAIRNSETGKLTVAGGSITYNDAFSQGGAIFNATGGTTALRSVSISNNSPNNCAPTGTIPGCSG